MIVFECANCGAALTEPLVDEPTQLIEPTRESARERVPRRRWSLAETEPFEWVETWPKGHPRATEGPVANTADAARGALAAIVPDDVGSATYGCCGYVGWTGPNHACRNCGAVVAIVVDDCTVSPDKQLRFVADAVSTGFVSELDIAATRARYLPRRIRTLFIAEAPPDDSWRFFYNDYVPDKDSLYLHIMRAVLGITAPVADLRRHKTSCLRRFCEDGHYLIDAIDERLPSSTTSAGRIKAILDNADAKIAEARDLLAERGTEDARIVLIKATVYDALAEPMRHAGLPIANTEKIPFPGSGQQPKFMGAMERLGGWPEQPGPKGPPATLYGEGWLL